MKSKKNSTFILKSKKKNSNNLLGKRTLKLLNRKYTQKAGAFNLSYNNIRALGKSSQKTSGEKSLNKYASSAAKFAADASFSPSLMSGSSEAAPLMLAAAAPGVAALGTAAAAKIGSYGSKAITGLRKTVTRQDLNTKKIKRNLIEIGKKKGTIPQNFDELPTEERKQILTGLNIDAAIKNVKAKYKTVKTEDKQTAGKIKKVYKELKKIEDSDFEEKQKQLKTKKILGELSPEEYTSLSNYKPGFLRKLGSSAERGAKTIYSDEKESLKAVGAQFTRKKAALGKEVSDYMKKIKGEEVDKCSLIKDKMGDEKSEGRIEELLRKTASHPFFKEEDPYFISLLKRNMKQFCFGKGENGEEEYYSIFCKSVLSCLKTPSQINDLLFQAIDAKSTKRMFDELPGSFDPSDAQTYLGRKYREKKEGTILNLKKDIVTRIMSQNKEIAEEKDNKQRFAMILSVLQNENKRALSAFIVEVLIKTIIDYKDAANTAPSGYTGKVKYQRGLDKLIKRLTESQKKTTNNQKGGSNLEDKPLTSAELKKIGSDDLYEGMTKCDTKDLIKSEYEDRKDESAMLEDKDIDIDAISEGLETPKLLYIVMGSFAIVTLIELGIFDAPECLTHTFL